MVCMCGMSECGKSVWCVYVYMCMCDVEVRGQLAGSSSDLEPRRLLGLNLGCQAWQQMRLPDSHFMALSLYLIYCSGSYLRYCGAFDLTV